MEYISLLLILLAGVVCIKLILNAPRLLHRPYQLLSVFDYLCLVMKIEGAHGQDYLSDRCQLGIPFMLSKVEDNFWENEKTTADAVAKLQGLETAGAERVVIPYANSPITMQI